MNCREIIKKLYEAFRREDWAEYDTWLYRGVKECDMTPGQLQEEMGRQYAEVLSRNMARELVSLYIAASLARSPKPGSEAITAVAVKYHPLLAPLNCKTQTKIVVGMVEMLKDAPIWDGPIWPAASEFIYLVEKRCGEVPDEVAEALGEEEYAQYKASREEGVAVVKYPDSAVRIAWRDVLI
jgi:hypothetical protein